MDPIFGDDATCWGTAMSSAFKATTMLHTEAPKDGRPMQITLSSALGQTLDLSLSAELARSLAVALAEYAEMAENSGIQPTKLPKSFSVGAGKYESVVLLRFEEDAPYALPAKDALTLAKALLNSSESVATRPIATLQ